MMARSRALLSAALLLSAGVFAGAANAASYNITFAGGHGTHLPWMKAIEEFYIPEVDKRLAAAGGKDKVVWTKAFGGTLAKIGGVLEAVQEGVADMAMVYTIFEPAKLPLMQVTFLAPFGSGDVTLISKIIVEMNNEMLSLWANGIGAVAVQGDFATHYNNVKTGVYDGLIAFTTGVYPIKIHEVAPYMTKVNLGATSIGAITINKKLFDSMSPETQKIFRDVGAEYSQRVSGTMKTLAGVFEKKMGEEGAKISEFPPAERKKWATTMPNIAKDWVKRNEERGEPAKKVLEAYMAKLRTAKVELVRDWDKE